ncbi:Zn-dependent hydrolase [Herbaspirillum lusitanum]|uniref:Zn-dependent hydrolase n=1 Tax=Herbaspirillum lusitanum TaxID=213312 RepID=A0ABW9A6N9_9BURK
MSASAAVAAPVQINATRLWQRLMTLAQIGATPNGGVNRQALSAEEIEAWHVMLAWAAEAGLDAFTDPAGNLFLRLAGRDATALPVLSGSHLDSQPTGGRFDGVYGVLAALEVLVSLSESGWRPQRDLIMVAWMNEEGSRFAPGMMGSEGFAHHRSMADIRAARDVDGVLAGDALDQLLHTFSELPQRPLGFPLAGYVEAHIEQGPVLEAQEKTIGVVTAIQGKKTFEVTIQGTRGHAGTLAMRERRDAVTAFARICCALDAQIGGYDDIVKFTIGRVQVLPNAPSVIAGSVSFSIDLRHPDNAILNALGNRVEAICNTEVRPCEVEVKLLVNAPSNGFDAAIQDMIEQSAATRGLPSMRLLSAAGHDARYMAPLCPSAMIFIPCRAGVSHAEHEWSEPEQVSAGANVLLDTLIQLAGE